MIWGMTLKPGVSYTKVLDEEVHLSLASMESREQFGKIWPGSYSQVVMKTEDVEFLLCTLVHGSTFQQPLDLKLMPKEKITFTAYGECLIYISGYSSSGPRIQNVRSIGDQAFDDISPPTETIGTADGRESEEESWIPEPEEQTQVRKTVRVGQNSQPGMLQEEEEQDCIEVMSYDDLTLGKSEPAGGAVSAETDKAEEYTILPDIASYAQENVMTTIKRYGVAGPQMTGKKSSGSIAQSQTKANTVPIPTALVKIENSSSIKENGITTETIAPVQSPSFGSCQIVGTLGSVSRARGLRGSSQTVKFEEQNDSFQKPEDSDSGSYVFAVSDTTVKADSDAAAVSYKPDVRVKVEKDTKKVKSKKKNATKKRTTALSSKKGKQYRCRFCCKTFLHAHSRVRHERIHTGIKPYQCKFCLKSFSDIGNKAKHERTHEDRGFACENCGKGFHSYDSHRKHKKVCYDATFSSR